MRHRTYLAVLLLSSLPLFAQGTAGVGVRMYNNGTYVETAPGINLVSGCSGTVSSGQLQLSCTGSGGSVTAVTPGIGVNSGAQSKVPVSTTGTLNTPLLESAGDSGSNVATRLEDVAGVTGNNGQIVSANDEQLNAGGGVLDVGNTNLDTPESTFWFGGGYAGAIRTNLGFNVGDRQIIQGSNTGLSGSTGPGSHTGTMFIASSGFPTDYTSGGGITASGTATQNTLNVSLSASGGSTLTIGPGDKFVVAGDSTVYTVTNCTAGATKGDFARGPQKFFEQALYREYSAESANSTTNILIDNPATRALAQMEGD